MRWPGGIPATTVQLMVARVKVRGTNDDECVDGNDEANHGRSWQKSCPKGGSSTAVEARAGSTAIGGTPTATGDRVH